MAMVEALDTAAGVSLEQRIGCHILPVVEHHIELGTPSWYGRFLAQVTVEPRLRAHVVRAHEGTPSVRRLDALGAPRSRGGDPALLAQHNAMVRQLAVNMCAELEYDLAHGHIEQAAAEESWRRLGDNLIRGICGLSVSLLGER
jgi:hypothetical protein